MPVRDIRNRLYDWLVLSMIDDALICVLVLLCCLFTVGLLYCLITVFVGHTVNAFVLGMLEGVIIGGVVVYLIGEITLC